VIQRSPEIEQETREAFDLMHKGDLAGVIERMSAGPGLVMIGSDPDEWYEGREEIESVMGSMGDAEPSAMPSAALDSVEAYSDGDVGWATVRGTWKIGSSAVQFRMTAVLHREDGQWKNVHTHASIGVPNSEMMNPMLQGAGSATA